MNKEPRISWWRQLLLALFGRGAGCIVWPAVALLLWAWWCAR